MPRARGLIVDDEPDMVENCVRARERADYHCLATRDPRQALEWLESGRPGSGRET